MTEGEERRQLIRGALGVAAKELIRRRAVCVLRGVHEPELPCYTTDPARLEMWHCPHCGQWETREGVHVWSNGGRME